MLALDILPTIIGAHAELFIKTEMPEAFSWTVFLEPFSIQLWYMLIFSSLFCTFALTFGGKECLNPLNSYIRNLEMVIKSYFGTISYVVYKNGLYQSIIFCLLLKGSLIWMFYRGSLTSKLSMYQQKLPFRDLETLLESEIQYVLYLFILS